MKRLRAAAIVASILLVLGWGAAQYLLGREAVPESSSYRLDPAELRVLASSKAGPLPLRVNHHVVAEKSMPRAAVFAGESFAPHRMIHGVYQVVYPDGYLLIDAALGREQFDELPGEGRYDEHAFEVLKQAMPVARKIVLTHEHIDHIEGLARAEDPAGLAERVLMNESQHQNPQTRDVLPDELLSAIEPVAYEGVLVIAPGVVLVEAAGHTPGSQLIYVLAQDGAELLLIGDVVWHMDALRELHYRPRLITDFILGEDRAAVMAQIRTLHGLLERGVPRIVVSHDAQQRSLLVRQGVLGDGLELGSSFGPRRGRASARSEAMGG